MSCYPAILSSMQQCPLHLRIFLQFQNVAMSLYACYNAICTTSIKSLCFMKISFRCDLAGSERIKATGVEGERLHEAQHINLSLLELGYVIMFLTSTFYVNMPSFFICLSCFPHLFCHVLAFWFFPFFRCFY